MPFDQQERYDAIVLAISGRFLGSIDGPDFKNRIDELIEQNRTHVVVDLSEAEMMDSSGIGVLIAAHASLRRKGGALRLARLEAKIRPLFMMTNLLGTVFDTYDTVEEAAKSFRADPPQPAENGKKARTRK